MADILLIHGSCHGAWCWRDVVPALAALGHSARAIDLPGHGADSTPAREVTLAGYAQAILDAIDDPVTLLGHSMGGFPITLAAQMAPEKVARLVYLCAYVPVAGMSLADMRRAGPSQPLLEAIEMAPDRATFTFRPEMVGAKLYHDCPPGTVDYAQARLCPQPVAPQATPIATLDRWAGVEKHAILCEEDRAIPPAYQATMAAGFPPGHVTRMATSHSPFFADPAGLAQRLNEIIP